jgi:signal transduction histidine kinase
MVRAERNLQRIMEMEYEVEDIIQERPRAIRDMLSLLLDQCADQLETMVAEEVGEGSLVERIRRRIDELFGAKEFTPEVISLDQYVVKRLEQLRALFDRRAVEISTYLEETPTIYMPRDPLQKVFDGLLKNAIENTPDGGKIEVFVQRKEKGTQLVVRDYGVGITKDNQKRIFDGFFATQETMDYSSKRPFDFDAGGKGADLLRMKIFSERYNFKITMTSSRCRFLTKATDVCPGKIDECDRVRSGEECHASGGTAFSVYFPPASRIRG